LLLEGARLLSQEASREPGRKLAGKGENGCRITGFSQKPGRHFRPGDTDTFAIGVTPMQYRTGAYLIDPAAFEIRRDGRRLATEPQVIELILLLIKNRNRVVSKDEIFEVIWHNRAVSDATLSSRIKAARHSLGDDGSAQQRIRTVHGRGFRFVGEVEELSGGGEQSPAAVVPQPGGRPSLVVMPFDNLSGADDAHFVDGVVEEITSALSRVRDFFVIARQSAFAYKGRFVDVREVGKELAVTYVVEGTVRRGQDRVRISVQVIDAHSRAQLWSERYDGATTDIFEFQDRIAAQVAGAIHPAVRKAEIELAKRKPPNSLKAYEFVLRAYPNLWSQNQDQNREAIQLLGKALTADPSYGRAHALLAWCLAQEVVYFWCLNPEQGRARALAAVAAAGTSIDDDPTALAAAGAALSQVGDQARAAAYIERALALDHNNAWAWARYGWIALYRDDPAGALQRFNRSLTLSPFDPLAFNTNIGIASGLAMRGAYHEAVGMVREVVNKHPEVTSHHRLLAALLALTGDLETARAAVSQILRTHPTASVAAMRISHPMRHLTSYFDKLVEGLRLAGLPET